MLAQTRLAALALALVGSFPLAAEAGGTKNPAKTQCPWWRPCGPGETWGGNRLIPQGGLGVDARPACQRHDDCYDTPGTRRKDCDKAFLNDLRSTCENSTNPRACKRRAMIAYIAVRLFAGSSKPN